ncbi:MAG TPA: hypothetical protein VM555_06405 [Tahibacter sp.]|jgi:hypothetical protein|nr:hypothetical protein [Tahibacter sp.]
MQFEGKAMLCGRDATSVIGRRRTLFAETEQGRLGFARQSPVNFEKKQQEHVEQTAQVAA